MQPNLIYFPFLFGHGSICNHHNEFDYDLDFFASVSRGVWQISGTPLDMHDPRLLAIAEAERQLFEADYDDYNGTNSSGAAFCRSAALIVRLYYCKFIIIICIASIDM